MKPKSLQLFIFLILWAVLLNSINAQTNSKKYIDAVFNKEKNLKEMAETAINKVVLNPLQPGSNFTAPSMYTSSLTTRSSLWGKPDNITISMLKTDIFDRRYIDRNRTTMADIIEGAYAETNKDINDMPMSGMTRSSVFSLDKRGGRYNHGIWSEIYPFPCQKPVGQVIIKTPDFEGLDQPEATEHLKSGEITINLAKGNKKLDIGYLLSMEKNVTGLDLNFENLEGDITFRIYRNVDQAHKRYMEDDGTFKKYVVYYPNDIDQPLEYYDLEADRDKNGKFEAPTYGTDGRFFWVHQVFPAEETFPEGFRYVLMGLVSNAKCELTEHSLQTDLGTKPQIPRNSQGILMVPGIRTTNHTGMIETQALNYSHVSEAPGVAVDATVKMPKTGKARLYFAIVTVNETRDYMEQAKKLLLDAEKKGYKGLVAENEAWYNKLYEKRENGRILLGKTEAEKEQIADYFFNEVCRSWTSRHMGNCFPDPRKYEGSAGYAAFDTDAQSWHSLPCYNELFTEGRFFMRNQYEPKIQWPNLLSHWHETLKEKARLRFGLPGMTVVHGYLPPAKQSPWYAEHAILEYTVEVPGQIMKVIWNFWDYTGDEEFLRETCYPLLKDVALFYEAFARRGWDGKVFNLEPTVETESYGISYKMEYTRNNTGALTMFRKILNLAVEAAEYLEVDADLIPGWKEVAENLAPYPMFKTGLGDVIGANEMAFPRYGRGDHEMYSGFYPVTLADEVTLDSPEELKELYSRSADIIGHNTTVNAHVLVGNSKDYIPRRYAYGAIKIENYATLASQITNVPERLMNSRSGRIHLFPVVPDWTVAAFRNFLARGAFEVSAARDERGVQAVTVKARRSISLKLMNPWVGKKPIVTDITTGKVINYTMDTSNGECIVFNSQADHTYSFDL